MTAVSTAPLADDAGGRSSPPPSAAATFVLLGGVPGAGKTTVLRRLRRDRPDLRAVDPERLRDLLGPSGLPYRWYRPLVHTLNAVHTLLRLLRGPDGSGTPLVVHDPATRPRRRELTGRLARRRGWEPVLVMLDVSREDALAGQRRRGRIVGASTFDAHWRRWADQRSRLSSAARAGVAEGPWARTFVVDRRTAASTLLDILG